MRFGTTELLIILVVVILLFGPSQIPKLGRTIGESIKELRRSVEGTDKNRP